MPDLDAILATPNGTIDTPASPTSPATTPQPSSPATQPISTPSPDPGKTATPSPEAGKAGTTATPAEADKGKAGTPEGQAQPAAKPTLTKDELRAAVSGLTAPEETLESLKKNYQASSREAQRLQGELKAVQELLGAQDFKVEVDHEGTRHLTYKGKKSTNFDDLPAEKREKFDKLVTAEEPNPEKIWDFVASMTRLPNPTTTERIVQKISPERESEAYAHIASKYAEMHGKIAEDRDVIGFMIDNAPRGVKEAYFEYPEFLLPLLHAKLEVIRAAHERLAQTKEVQTRQKEAEAQKAAGLSATTPPGTALSGGGVTDAIRQEIVNA